MALDVDVGQGVAHVRVFGQRFAVADGFAAMLQEMLPEAGAADMPAAAVLQFQMGGGHPPAVVLAPDQAGSGHPHVLEKDGVLLAASGAALAGSQQVHRLNRDTRQARVDHEPAQVLVALAARIGSGQRPHPVGAVFAADKDLLTVEHVLVALPDRPHLDAGQVRAGVGLREQLPYALLAPVNRR